MNGKRFSKVCQGGIQLVVKNHRSKLSFDKDAFYELFDREYKKCPKHNVKIKIDEFGPIKRTAYDSSISSSPIRWPYVVPIFFQQSLLYK